MIETKCPSCGADIPDQNGYWLAQLKIERKRADDNLRLAAERAAEINELRKEIFKLREKYSRVCAQTTEEP